MNGFVSPVSWDCCKSSKREGKANHTLCAKLSPWALTLPGRPRHVLKPTLTRIASSLVLTCGWNFIARRVCNPGEWGAGQHFKRAPSCR